MANDSQKRPTILLIDLDNCHVQAADLADLAKSYTKVIGVHGSQEPRIPIGASPIIAGLVAAEQLEIWSMPAGKNAADFGITFLAGRLAAEPSSNTRFEIASKDKDLDHAVRLLRQVGFQAKRINCAKTSTQNAANQPKVQTRKSSDSALLSLEAFRLARILIQTTDQTQPKRLKTMQNAAKSWCGSEQTGNAALAELASLDALQLPKQNSKAQPPKINRTRLEELAAAYKAAKAAKAKPNAKPKPATKPAKSVPTSPPYVDGTKQLSLFD